MKFQLVIQFEASSEEDFDKLIEIEEIIENLVGSSHEVDGHDFGSGEMNIFIYTNNPNKAFELIKSTLSESVENTMKVAYREVKGEEYTVIWPLGFNDEFEIK